MSDQPQPKTFQIVRKTVFDGGELVKELTDREELLDEVHIQHHRQENEISFSEDFAGSVRFDPRSGEVVDHNDQFKSLEVTDNDNILIEFEMTIGPGGPTTLKYEIEVDWNSDQTDAEDETESETDSDLGEIETDVTTHKAFIFHDFEQVDADATASVTGRDDTDREGREGSLGTVWGIERVDETTVRVETQRFYHHDVEHYERISVEERDMGAETSTEEFARSLVESNPEQVIAETREFWFSRREDWGPDVECEECGQDAESCSTVYQGKTVEWLECPDHGVLDESGAVKPSPSGPPEDTFR